MKPKSQKHRWKYPVIIAMCLLSMMLSSCATIVRGSNQKIQIDSTPTGARATIYDRGNNVVYESQTPFVASLSRKGNYRIVMQKEGYEPYNAALTSSGGAGWLWTNIGLTVVGTAVFFATIDYYEGKTVWEGDPLYPGGSPQPNYFEEINTGMQIANFSSAAIAGVSLVNAITDGVTGSAKTINPKRINARLTETRQRQSDQALEGAIERAANQIQEGLPRDERIAIMNIETNDRGLREYIISELEHYLRLGRFDLVDRRNLDRVRSEWNFQGDMDVDENTQVEIGKLAGANIVIVGSIVGTGDIRRLTLRALDVTTGRVISTASQRI